MKKTIRTVLIVGSLMSMVGATALYADQTEMINQKAKVIMHDAKVKGDKLIKDAKAKAQALIEQAKEDTADLKKESAQSMKETTAETKALANEAMEKAKRKGHELVEKTKALPQVVKQGVKDKYVYAKEAINKKFDKSKDAINDMRINAAIKYAFLMSENIHSMKIDVDVKDGVVELFGKVKSNEEAEEAMQIALSMRGVRAVKSLFFIEE